jgi:hypothetical protein
LGVIEQVNSRLGMRRWAFQDDGASPHRTNEVKKHSMQSVSQSLASFFIGRSMLFTSIPVNKCGEWQRVRSTVNSATLQRNSPSTRKLFWLMKPEHYLLRNECE